MFRRMLTALGHPAPREFNVNDEKEFRSVVLWVEDQKIRLYTIEDREGLRNIESPTWPETFMRYQEDLASPVMNGSPQEQLGWILCFAVRLEYMDNVEKYKKNDNHKTIKPKKEPKMVSKSFYDSIDFSNQAVIDSIDKLAVLTKVLPHPDPRIKLAAIAKIIKNAPHPHPPPGEPTIPIKTPKDSLEVLFLQDLRDLQTQINEILVAVQNITSNPKTDTTLGKVGR